MRKLATPVPSTDGDITEEVAKITYRADLEGGLGSLPGPVRGVRPLDADPEHAERDAELPGPPDLQQRRGRQLERPRRAPTNARADA